MIAIPSNTRFGRLVIAAGLALIVAAPAMAGRYYQRSSSRSSYRYRSNVSYSYGPDDGYVRRVGGGYEDRGAAIRPNSLNARSGSFSGSRQLSADSRRQYRSSRSNRYYR